MAKISLIVPVYNVEDYLDICLDSILAQSFKDFEVICVNDGSTDSSLEILKKYAKFDKRIKIYNKENGGLSDARNFGMKKISAKYVMFVDSDDWLSHVALERLYKNIIQYDSDFNFCGVRKVDDFTRDNPIWLLCHPEEFKNYVKTPSFNPDDIKSEFMYKMHFMAWGKLYKSEFIKDFSFPKGKIFEDNPFFAECYLSAKRISFDFAPLYYYRVNRPNSIIETKAEKYKDIFDIADIVKEVFVKHSKFEKYKTDYILYYLKSFFCYTARIKDDKTRELSFKLLKERLDKFESKEFDKEKLEKDGLFKTIYSVKNMDYSNFKDFIKKGGFSR